MIRSINKEILPVRGRVFSFEEYLKWVREIASTEGMPESKYNPRLMSFVSLNLKRMERIRKTIVISNELKESVRRVRHPQQWYLIVEPWCGDCAQIVPVIASIAEHPEGSIDLKIFTRDDNEEWMSKYTTNGTRSVPKLIAFDATGNELFTWGPRPAQAQQIMKEWKEDPDAKSWDDFEIDLHTWYAKDKTKSVQDEFIELFDVSAELQEDITTGVCPN